MSTPARSLRGRSSASKANFLSDDERSVFLDELHDRISGRAYSLFEEFGRADGNDLAHWLQAERELASFPTVQESKDAFTVAIPVGEIPADQIKVCATDRKVIVSTRNERGSDSEGQKSSEGRSFYYMASWPEPVSADSYTAEMHNGVLTLTVGKIPRADCEARVDSSRETGSETKTSKNEAR